MQKKPKSLSKIIKTAVVITAILAVIEIIIIYFMMADKKPDKKIAATQQTEETSKPINTEAVKDTTKPVAPPPVAQTQPPPPVIAKQETPIVEAPKQKVLVDTVKKTQPVKKQEPVANITEQPKKQLAENIKPADKKEKPPAEKKVAVQPKQLGEDEMSDILNRINAEKLRTNSKANCIQVLKTSKGNVENWLQVANYLKTHGFIISGREVVESTVKGVHINASGSCIKLTIGTM